jgi:hypothetical protein
MHGMSGCREIMLNADMAMWHACAVAAIWHAGMRIVLVSTHMIDMNRTEAKTQSGTCTASPLIYPQRSKVACRHYENQHQKMRAHLRRSVCARLHCAPGHCQNCLRTWGGTQCENTAQMPCTRGVCSWAGRACGVEQMASNSHAADVGGKCEAVCMGGVVGECLCHLVRRLPSGRRGWHLRVANKCIETCARTADMSGMITYMDGMQQTACHEHV